MGQAMRFGRLGELARRGEWVLSGPLVGHAIKLNPGMALGWFSVHEGKQVFWRWVVLGNG